MKQRKKDPTPQEIAERSAEIRATWSPAKERQRIVPGYLQKQWAVLAFAVNQKYMIMEETEFDL